MLVDFNGLVGIVQKDFFIIIVCLITILVCLGAAYRMGQEQTWCNEFWQGKLYECGCLKNFTDTYTWGGIEIDYHNKNNNS